MLLQKEGNGLFAALPTEICHFVLEYMDKQSRDAFAKCSRHCYSIAFPARFIGIKLSEVNHRYWLKVFTRGWLAPLSRWVHTVVLDIAEIKYITALPLKLTAFPNLRGLKFSIHAPKPFEGNVFDAFFSTLSTLPFYHNITHISIGWYGYHTRLEAPGLLFIGGGDGPAQLQNEIKEEEKTRDDYERDLGLFPEARDILGPHLSGVKVIEKTLSGDIYYPQNLQSLELSMGCQMPYYYTPMLNCSTVTTLIFVFFPSDFRGSTQLTNSLQFPTVKNMIISHVGVYSNTAIIAKHFPNVEFMAVTKYCSLYWTEFIRSLPQIKTFSLPWEKLRWRYTKLDFLERGINRLLAAGYIQHFPTITFSGDYGAEGGARQKYISVTCKIFPNAHGYWDFNWEGDTDYKPEDMPLPDYQQEMLNNAENRRNAVNRRDAENRRGEEGSGEEMDAESEHSEYVDNGSNRYRRSDGEEDEEWFSGDSEYWEDRKSVV